MFSQACTSEVTPRRVRPSHTRRDYLNHAHFIIKPRRIAITRRSQRRNEKLISQRSAIESIASGVHMAARRALRLERIATSDLLIHAPEFGNASVAPETTPTPRKHAHRPVVPTPRNRLIKVTMKIAKE